LLGTRHIPLPETRRSPNGHNLIVRGARENNLRDLDVTFPLGLLICITGVSGAGKSSLIHEILFKRLYAHLHDKRVLPGVNTSALAVREEAGVWASRCAACGDCMLSETYGLCPVARCSKSLMNGPCGGSSGGKCEISPDVDCIWDMIVRKMMDKGQTEELERLMPLKDWSKARDGGPRIRIKEDLRK